VLGASLEINITPTFSGSPIHPNSLRYQTSAGETFSITRVSFLVSGIALQRVDGSLLELTNQVGWFDMEARRSLLCISNVPPDLYRSLRFHVGLDKKQNHDDPAKFAAEHPLNPNLNGLHWGWQGGYIFLAIEGLWRNANGITDGWSYHLARDTNRTPINLEADLSLTHDLKLEIDFDLSVLLNAPRPLSFGKDGSSTHSRDEDPITAALVANSPGSFRLRQVSALSAEQVAATTPKPRYLPEKYTPYVFQMSASFPIPDLPKDNPLIEERVALGEKLFRETALSRDGTLSCASCHKTSAGFSDPRRYSVGVREQVGTRNAMPLFNLAWKSSFFWDGRAPSLRAQALTPIQDHTEMDESLTNVVAKLNGEGDLQIGQDAQRRVPTANYPALFTAAFGSPEITAEKIGLAFEQFLLTLTSFDSKFDRAMHGEEKLNVDEQRGFELFMTEYDPRTGRYGADCFHCHGGALFSDHQFHNNGLGWDDSDLGRSKVTKLETDKGKFSTPSLRNVALTAPYMHDGRFATLEDVIDHYNSGVKQSATLDPNLAKHPTSGLGLSAEDKRALVAFLKTLTDEKFSVGNSQFAAQKSKGKGKS